MKLMILAVTVLFTVFGVGAQTLPNNSEAEPLKTTPNKYQAGLF
ncbi:hypothetical protein MNBD_GAMMA02-1099 [hydrothermal vent metagenome]|uniref:Uncharacterized protein n=1 Tax=hydrothermal vent metagenome TaxID=652676 RepID=A0A3B0W9Y7_9ZZZZ